MARQTGDSEPRDLVLPDVQPDWRDYLTFILACIGIIATVICGGLALVWLWEVL